MIPVGANHYDVGGVRLPRPFHIRRLGHFGLNVGNLEANIPFYRDMLGFAISDILDLSKVYPNGEELKALGDARAVFTRHGTDHHSFVLFEKPVYMALRGGDKVGKEVSVNQITFQIGSLQEVVDAAEWLVSMGTPMRRSGRDIPGSNWHSYFYDPDGHIIELYYGIEQIGWDGTSKPRIVHAQQFSDVPNLPQRPEFEEVNQVIDSGGALSEGYRHREKLPLDYEVEGIRMARPFKINAIGPVRLFADDVEASIAFWTERMGLILTERRGEWAFLRCAGEHHSIAIYPKSLREKLPVRQTDTLLSFGVRLTNYAQLRAAREWLASKNVEMVDLPSEIHPGVDRAFYARTPDGHLIELHWHMDPAYAKTTEPTDNWPDLIDPPGALYATEQLLGPWA